MTDVPYDARVRNRDVIGGIDRAAIVAAIVRVIERGVSGECAAADGSSVAAPLDPAVDSSATTVLRRIAREGAVCDRYVAAARVFFDVNRAAGASPLLEAL